MLLRAREHQEPPEAGRSKEGFSAIGLVGSMDLEHFNFGLWPLELQGINFCGFKSPICSNLYKKHKKLIIKYEYSGKVYKKGEFFSFSFLKYIFILFFYIIFFSFLLHFLPLYQKTLYFKFAACTIFNKSIFSIEQPEIILLLALRAPVIQKRSQVNKRW